jgi:hypothetical protein
MPRLHESPSSAQKLTALFRFKPFPQRRHNPSLNLNSSTVGRYQHFRETNCVPPWTRRHFVVRNVTCLRFHTRHNLEGRRRHRHRPWEPQISYSRGKAIRKQVPENNIWTTRESERGEKVRGRWRKLRSFVICTSRQILSASSNERLWDARAFSTVCGAIRNTNKLSIREPERTKLSALGTPRGRWDNITRTSKK